MKKYILKSIAIALSVAFVLSAGSCKKYLEVENPSNLSQNDVFNSLAYTSSAITGVYNRLGGDDGYGSRLSIIYPQSADDFKTSGSYSPLDRRGISEYGVAPQNTELNNPFRQLYDGIERANICIKYIPLSPVYLSGTPTEQAQMRKFLGEALTLRAWFFHELIRNWGDLPASFEPSADVADLYLEKMDRDEIYDKLLSDLAEATELVPWRSESNDPSSRITKAAVKGIRARIALARGGYSLRRESRQMERKADYLTFYEIARKECLDIMNQGENKLNPSFENVFKTLHGSNSLDPTHELIFEVGAFGANARTDSKLGYGNGLRQNTNSSYGYANGGVRAIPTYFYEFDPQDGRRDVTLGIFEINADDQKTVISSVNMTDAKYRRYWTNSYDASQQMGINWPLLRYSDVLLLFAEADNEINQGPGPEAIQAFREVRTRAFNGEESLIGTIPSDYQGFFNALVKERLLEFGGEGIRKYDLLRWNLIEEIINETREKLRLFKDGEGIYSNVPEKIYFKLMPFQNKTVKEEMDGIDFFGGNINDALFQPSQSSAPQGYTSVNWRAAVDRGYIEGVNDAGQPSGSGYIMHFVKGQSELLPIYSEIINENYRLTQDYGY